MHYVCELNSKMNNYNICYCIIPNCNNFAYHGTNIPEYCDNHCINFYNLVGNLNMVNKQYNNDMCYNGDIYDKFDLRRLYNHIGRIQNDSYLMYNENHNYFYIVDFNNILNENLKEQVINLYRKILNLKFEYISSRDSLGVNSRLPDVIFSDMFDTHSAIERLLNN